MPVFLYKTIKQGVIIMKNKKYTVTKKAILSAVIGLFTLAFVPVQAQQAAEEFAITPDKFSHYGSYRVVFNSANQLPVDPEVKFNDKPAWRYEVEPGFSASTAFCFFMVPLDIERFLPNGHLEFAIKSTAKATRNLIGVGFAGDWASGERYINYNQGSLDWQVIRIPLSDLNIRSMIQRLALTTTGEPETEDMTFWISDIKIVP
jgi:hypothetical protein